MSRSADAWCGTNPRSPYRIDGPAAISFSGGRTSGYMLRKILDAHDGQLPEDVVVQFANTGKEREETLVFVRECGERWGVPIVWLERRRDDAEQPPSHRVVSFETAARNGEPFGALIRERGFLPGPALRFCTQELKQRTLKSHCMSLGWEYWTNVVGLRADEPRRVARATGPTRERWDVMCPLAAAQVTEADVLAFWREQPFDLGLKSYEGNCDVCYLKSFSKRVQLARDNPSMFDWWTEQERWAESVGAKSNRFAPNQPSYGATLAFARDQFRLPIVTDDEDAIPCACTD